MKVAKIQESNSRELKEINGEVKGIVGKVKKI